MPNPYMSPKLYVEDTQKNCFNETIFLVPTTQGLIEQLEGYCEERTSSLPLNKSSDIVNATFKIDLVFTLECFTDV